MSVDEARVLSPAVVAEDLAALADVLPFDERTRRLLDRAAELAELAEQLDHAREREAAVRAVCRDRWAPGIRGQRNVDVDEVLAALGPTGDVVDEPVAPSREAIGQAIATALDCAGLKIELWQETPTGYDDVEHPSARLARTLDAAGLIDWSALSGSVEAADTPPSGTSGHEAGAPAEPAQYFPRRDSDVAAWLKATRDAQNNPAIAEIVDRLLDDYRLHADTGTPLGEHACEGPNCCPDNAREVAGTPAEPECCDCGCTHQHQPDPTLIYGPGCILCRYCSCPTGHLAREVAGTPAAEPALGQLTDERALTVAAEIIAAMTDSMDGAYSGDGGLLWNDWVLPVGDCYDLIADYAEGVATDEGKRAQLVIAARAMIAAALAGAGAPTEPDDDTQETNDV